MPAGALFSAPLVGQASEHTRRSSEWKATINYWFRHIWEYWWPLYPGVVVAISVFGMENWRFFITQAPFTLVAVGSGYAFLVHRHLHELTADTDTSRPPGRRLLFIMLPLAIVIVGVLLFPYVLKPLASELNEQDIRLVAMLVSLVMGMFTILYDEKKRTGKIKVFSSLLKPKSLGILLTIFGVMVFKHMLEFSGMVGVASDELQAANINLVYVVAALPFLAGLITGVAVGFTGASFPFVVGLLNAAGSGLHPMSTLALAYGFGYMGMMLSPVHLCLLVTRDYFDSSIYGVYRHVAPCALTILAFSVLAHMLFAFLGV
jgi:integral membrane protein (TIGR00529 family)